MITAAEPEPGLLTVPGPLTQGLHLASCRFLSPNMADFLH